MRLGSNGSSWLQLGECHLGFINTACAVGGKPTRAFGFLRNRSEGHPVGGSNSEARSAYNHPSNSSTLSGAGLGAPSCPPPEFPSAHLGVQHQGKTEASPQGLHKWPHVMPCVTDWEPQALWLGSE